MGNEWLRNTETITSKRKKSKPQKNFKKETNEKMAVVEEFLREPTPEKLLKLKKDVAFPIEQELHFEV